LASTAAVISNPVVGIASIAARKVFETIKTDRERMAYLDKNYPATAAAERARRAANRTQVNNSEREGDSTKNRTIPTPAGNTDMETLLAEMQGAGLPQQDQLQLILSVFV
jgi:hypothetical protein